MLLLCYASIISDAGHTEQMVTFGAAAKINICRCGSAHTNAFDPVRLDGLNTKESY